MYCVSQFKIFTVLTTRVPISLFSGHAFSISDFESLLHNVNKDKKGLRGEKPRLERVPVCSCILVTGLKKESTDITIDLYFENVKRSGGRDVCRVERIREDQAVVHFEDHTSKKYIRTLCFLFSFFACCFSFAVTF